MTKKVKKIKKIPSKIKEIEPKPDISESDLEREVERTSAQKEVDSFMEFVSGVSASDLSGGLEQGSARSRTQTTQNTTSREEQTAETGQERVSYEGAGAGTYTTAGPSGARVRERNMYNPTIRQTETTFHGDVQTTPAQLTNRSITGRQFIGQEQPVSGQELEGTDQKKDYKAAHEGR
jgi:hypothetical protein